MKIIEKRCKGPGNRPDLGLGDDAKEPPAGEGPLPCFAAPEPLHHGQTLLGEAHDMAQPARIVVILHAVVLTQQHALAVSRLLHGESESRAT